MAQCGMLAYAPTTLERVDLFTVAKDFSWETGLATKSGLTLDCRLGNFLFQDPSGGLLGNLAGLAPVELDEAVSRGRRRFFFQGDVPDWFYRLHWGSSLAEYFVVEDGSSQGLY